jgi:MFS family permease
VKGLRSLLVLMRDRDFALLSWGGLVSSIGNGFTFVAVGWFLAERGAPEQLGLYFLAFEVAAVVGGLLLTGIMDAYSRRKLMIIDAVVRGLAVAAIPFAEMLSGYNLGVLMASAAVLGFFSPAADVGHRAMVVDLLDEGQLSAANGAESILWTSAWLIGPAVGGVLVALIGTFPTLWIDAASFAVFAIALAAMSPRADRLPERSEKRHGYRRDMAEGFAYVRREPIMLTIVQLTATARFAEGIFMVALPFLVKEAGGEAYHLGILLAMGGLGSLVGSLIAVAVKLPFPMTRSVSVLAGVGGVSTVLIALTPPLWVVGVIVALQYAITAPWNIYILTLRQRVPPPELVGRVLSLTMILNAAGQPGGSAVGGGLIGPLGVPIVLAGCGVFELANAATSLGSRRWRNFPMRDLHDDEASAAPLEAPRVG